MRRAKILTVLSHLWFKIKCNPFPTLLLSAFFVLTVLGVSGSSFGNFDQLFLGKSPGLLLGTPRPVRSDEWLVQSQETLIQKAANYPAVNKNIGLGQDMTMILDVPSRSIFGAFKPQNLFFFIMPYANAFAAKWWFMSLILVLGFYYLMDALFPRKRLIIGIASLILLLNPFVQWWYQSSTLLTIGYALWACLMLIKVFENKTSNKHLIIYGSGLAYFVLCFTFLFYPPFQLSIAYVTTAFLAGYFYYRYFEQGINIKQDLKPWAVIILSAITTIAIMSAFIITHAGIIQTIMNTSYPGTRNIISGQYDNNDAVVLDGESRNMIYTFSAPILVNLQSANMANNFYANQSEASRIVAINLILLPVFVIVVLKKSRKKRYLEDYLLLSTAIIATVFMIRMFTPFFNPIFKLLLFGQVQNVRLAISLVLLCVLQLVLFGIIIAKEKITVKVVGLVALIAFALSYDASMMLVHQYPKFMSGGAVLIASLVIGLVAFLMLQKKYFAWGLMIFALFSIASSVFVNPLYYRSEPVTLQSATARIKSRYQNNKSWIVVDSVAAENIPSMSNMQSFSGVQAYPQLDLWHILDPQHIEQQKYNRYAHVLFSIKPMPGTTIFSNPQQDVLLVRFDCDIAKKLPNFGYALSSTTIVDPTFTNCMKLDSAISYPNITLNIYKYSPDP